MLPANTIIAAPADAAEYLKTSGKFTTPDRKRTEALGTVPGKDGVRLTGLSLPFDGQPMQGFSGIKTMADGTFWSLSDNGFGSKLNSSDTMLMLHNIKIDWDAGKVEALKTLFLSDPDRKAPFPIVMEGAATALPDRRRFRRRIDPAGCRRFLGRRGIRSLHPEVRPRRQADRRHRRRLSTASR